MDHQLAEDICRRLGGHPLAIELAAAQADFYGLAELQEIVGQDMMSLAAPYQDAPPEHRSMTTLLEGMWSQLSPAARATLAQLSIFASAFSHEAMQAVAPAKAARALTELHYFTPLAPFVNLAYSALCPVTQGCLAAQAFDIDDRERAALWATDRDAVMALLAEVEEVIERLGDQEIGDWRAQSPISSLQSLTLPLASHSSPRLPKRPSSCHNRLNTVSNCRWANEETNAYIFAHQPEQPHGRQGRTQRRRSGQDRPLLYRQNSAGHGRGHGRSHGA